jgi:hypothetical protein
MRALRIAAGIAVLLNALHFVHAIQHFAVHHGPHTAVGWAAIAGAILMDVLTFVGGFLLLWHRR